jgi:hypothetical protein
MTSRSHPSGGAADFAVDQAVRDQLEHPDLARGRLLPELLQRPGERHDASAPPTAPLRRRVEAAALIDVTGEDR